MPSSAAVLPINNYETNNRRRQGGAARPHRPHASRRPDLLGPTPERLAKGDVVKMAAGHYRAPPPIERLRDRGSLDPAPHVNQAMFEAAEKLVGYFHAAGLTGVGAQDLSRTVTGSGDAPASMPVSEKAAHCRGQFRLACKLMGWPEGAPHRGAGRLTVAVICFEMGVKDAAAIYLPGGSTEGRLGAGMDRLREGLYALAVHWRLC